MSCGVGCRHGSDLALLLAVVWAVAVALIQPLAWELPYALGAAHEKKKKNQGVSTVARWVKNLTSIHEDAGSSLALLSGLRIWRSCELQMQLGSGIAVAVA